MSRGQRFPETEGAGYPETDLTKWTLRFKHAPLTASGTHEVIGTFVTKQDGENFARVARGQKWRRTYELVRKER